MKKFQPLVLLFVVLPLLSSCGKQSKLDVTVVTGTVTVDGRPMGEISITFYPVDGNEIAAFGSTDTQGKFNLSSPSVPVGSGALPGEYVPTFSKTETEERPAAATLEEHARLYGDTLPEVFHLIPQKYGDPKTCGIAPVRVEKGKKNHFDFELKSSI